MKRARDAAPPPAGAERGKRSQTSLGRGSVGLSPQLRALRSRIGGYTVHARHDSRRITANGRASFLARFEAEADPDGSLPPAERNRRAMSGRKAYFARLAYLSARARARRAKS